MDLFGDGRVLCLQAGCQDGDSSHGSSVTRLNDDSFGGTLDGVGGKESDVSARVKDFYHFRWKRKRRFCECVEEIFIILGAEVDTPKVPPSDFDQNNNKQRVPRRLM